MNLNEPDNLRTEFLYKAIEDTQGTIRFTDTKASVVLVSSGVLLTFVVPLGKTLLLHINSNLTITSAIAFLIGSLFFLFLIAAILISFKAINPLSSPGRHIVSKGLTSKLLFYPWDIEPKMSYKDLLIEKSNSMLNHKADDFLRELSAPDAHNEILTCLSLEFHKVAYIREKKLFRTNKAISLFKLSIVLLIIFSVFVYYLKW